MKKICILAIFACLSLLAYAQDVPALYTAVSGSVVYLQHEITLNSLGLRPSGTLEAF